MTKTEFLKELQRKLSWRFNEYEVADILTDYESFFVSDQADGKDESEICAELGDPAEIVKELADSLGKKRKTPLWRYRILTRMLCTMAIGIAAFISNRIEPHLYPINILLYVVVIAIIWFMLAGFTRKLPSAEHRSSKTWQTHLILCHIGLPLFVLCDYFFFYKNALSINPEIGIYPPETTMFYWNNILVILWYLPLLVAVISVLRFYRTDPLWFTVIAHAFGVNIQLRNVYKILLNVTSVETMPKGITLFIPYIVSIIITILFTLLIYMRTRRAN